MRAGVLTYREADGADRSSLAIRLRPLLGASRASPGMTAGLRPSLARSELLAVGTELLVGETRDTNSGDLARWLTELGVEVVRASALPDRLDVVTSAIRDALAHVDLVVLTGGLGPTPDDLTRESIAAATGRTPAVDPELEEWLRGLFERRGAHFVE